MYCKHCGKEISETAKFCDGCGKPVVEEIKTVTVPEQTLKKKKKRHPILGTIILIFGILIIVGVLSSDPAPSQPELSKEEYIALCSEISYDDIARNPDSYKGEYFSFTGEVIQVMEQGNYVNLRVNVTPETILDTTYYTDTIFVVASLPDGGDRILEEDIITVYGVCKGLHTYTTVLGAEMSIPRIDAGYWDIVK